MTFLLECKSAECPRMFYCTKNSNCVPCSSLCMNFGKPIGSPLCEAECPDFMEYMDSFHGNGFSDRPVFATTTSLNSLDYSSSSAEPSASNRGHSVETDCICTTNCSEEFVFVFCGGILVTLVILLVIAVYVKFKKQRCQICKCLLPLMNFREDDKSTKYHHKSFQKTENDYLIDSRQNHCGSNTPSKQLDPFSDSNRHAYLQLKHESVIDENTRCESCNLIRCGHDKDGIEPKRPIEHIYKTIDEVSHMTCGETSSPMSLERKKPYKESSRISKDTLQHPGAAYCSCCSSRTDKYQCHDIIGMDENNGIETKTNLNQGTQHFESQDAKCQLAKDEPVLPRLEHEKSQGSCCKNQTGSVYCRSQSPQILKSSDDIEETRVKTLSNSSSTDLEHCAPQHYLVATKAQTLTTDPLSLSESSMSLSNCYSPNRKFEERHDHINQGMIKTSHLTSTTKDLPNAMEELSTTVTINNDCEELNADSFNATPVSTEKEVPVSPNDMEDQSGARAEVEMVVVADVHHCSPTCCTGLNLSDIYTEIINIEEGLPSSIIMTQFVKKKNLIAITTQEGSEKDVESFLKDRIKLCQCFIAEHFEIITGEPEVLLAPTLSEQRPPAAWIGPGSLLISLPVATWDNIKNDKDINDLKDVLERADKNTFGFTAGCWLICQDKENRSHRALLTCCHTLGEGEYNHQDRVFITEVSEDNKNKKLVVIGHQYRGCYQECKGDGRCEKFQHMDMLVIYVNNEVGAPLKNSFQAKDEDICDGFESQLEIYEQDLKEFVDKEVTKIGASSGQTYGTVVDTTNTLIHFKCENQLREEKERNQLREEKEIFFVQSLPDSVLKSFASRGDSGALVVEPRQRTCAAVSSCLSAYGIIHSLLKSRIYNTDGDIVHWAVKCIRLPYGREYFKDKHDIDIGFMDTKHQKETNCEHPHYTLPDRNFVPANAEQSVQNQHHAQEGLDSVPTEIFVNDREPGVKLLCQQIAHKSTKTEQQESTNKKRDMLIKMAKD